MPACPALRTQLSAPSLLAHRREACPAARRWRVVAPACVLFTADQLQAGLAKQLQHSSTKTPAPARHQTQESLIPQRKPSRREARAAAAAAEAAQAEAARQQSAATQHALQLRCGGGLDEDTVASALRWQLRQSGTFDEAEPF